MGGSGNWKRASQDNSSNIRNDCTSPLLYKNGSAEARSQVMHMNYFSSTVDYNGDDLDNVCPDIVEGLLLGR